MLRMLLKWTFGVVAVLITIRLAHMLGLTLEWPSVASLIIFVPVLALVNVIIGSILRLLAMPITCLTLGLFSFIINAFVFWIAGAATGAHMSFWGALFGSLCTTLISGLLNGLIREKE